MGSAKKDHLFGSQIIVSLENRLGKIFPTCLRIVTPNGAFEELLEVTVELVGVGDSDGEVVSVVAGVDSFVEIMI